MVLVRGCGRELGGSSWTRIWRQRWMLCGLFYTCGSQDVGKYGGRRRLWSGGGTVQGQLAQLNTHILALHAALEHA